MLSRICGLVEHRAGQKDGSDNQERCPLTFVLPTHPAQRCNLRVGTAAQEKYHGRCRTFSGKHFTTPRQPGNDLRSNKPNLLKVETGGSAAPSCVPGTRCTISTVSPGIDAITSSKPFQPTIGWACTSVLASPFLEPSLSAPFFSFSAAGLLSTPPFCATHCTSRTLIGA